MVFVEHVREGNTFLDRIVKGLFEAKQHELAEMAFTYAERVRLLSDRGFRMNIRQAGCLRYVFRRHVAS